uniref:CAZy families GH43 protein n=1 Tax=uncultured Prevotella sp. TaxID=159272 RepID=A0A060C4I8_9BACT|nr:CAZy families GH43 protein [uncultured Prevotella sp.]
MGKFLSYATEDIHNTPIYQSENLVDWTFMGTAFTDENPARRFEPKGGLWAPDINYVNGKICIVLFDVGLGRGMDVRGSVLPLPTNPRVRLSIKENFFAVMK